MRLLSNVVPLHEEAFVFDAMLQGWRNQQLSRGLNRQGIDTRIGLIRRFTLFCERSPWQWTATDLEDFTVHLTSRGKPLARSTVRSYHGVVRAFCAYLTDGRYEWMMECEARFGSAPQQICHDWNTTVHLLEYEGRAQRRALTFEELEAFFSCADQRVDLIVATGKKGGLAALRDAQIFKTVYAFGLRRAEVLGLDTADLRPNPAAPRFESFGAVQVRWGKGSRGSGPKRRTVLTVPEFDWAIEGLQQWVEQGRSRFATTKPTSDGRALWPTERGTRVSDRYLAQRFAEIRDEAGLPPELSLHCLRHTYITNLIEWGYSEKFVQDQVGHLYASTTAIYTSVGDDYKNRVIAQALSRIYGSSHATS
ncbi:site-specific integrase [Arthrobacter cheniae]|uniref:Site-specific integrase n=2 Tax=Arthrobacter cheniae TaxID=1258888 RepID=A0A3A5LZA0_9MICC|nr:site-specific integrase [Arthrobacter cheniae]